ncbi:hypothetical protein GWK47_048195 [Chionoecetes opilio]|uniref:Uncharacterized protein n=1 Tax=Chionoecetes opilio TaxID=41210 RepID=A0A8J4YBA7_CHIOP|nr:hypothetical protein GWK47_048195 [Chionoecetes opilio]
MAVEEAKGGVEEMEVFMEEYSKCQVFLAAVFRAVREAVPEGVLRRLLAGYHSDTFHLGDVLWLGREEGDGMPLLHWAALHGNTAALRLILKPPQPTPPPPHLPLNTRFCVDEVRDPWRRTPLHYALGLQEGAALAAALMDAGCSEHTLDRHGREPLDFRDVRGSPALEALLGDLRDRGGAVGRAVGLHVESLHSVYRDPHPDPWDPEVLRAHQEHQRRQRFHQHQHHHHHHHHHHPAKFPTPPSSNFYWPLPRTVVEEEEEEKKRGWSVCKVM